MNSSINFNHVILRRRHQRNIIRINQRIQRQRRRIITRMYRGRAPVNNADTLSRIAQLPLQIKTISLQIKCLMDLLSINYY